MRSPLVFSVLSDVETPVSLFHRLRQSEPMAFLFESADGDKRMARFSLIGLDPLVRLQVKNGEARIKPADGEEIRMPVNDPMALLRQLQADHLPAVAPLADLPLTAGWVGYLGYGLTRHFEAVPQQEADPLDVPDLYLGLYDTMIVFDHLYRRIYVVSHREPAAAQVLLQKVQALLADRTPLAPLAMPDQLPGEAELFAPVTASMSAEAFCERVEQARQAIIEGQTFQIVLAQRFSQPMRSAPLDAYRMLLAVNPSPYAYYLQFPEFAYFGSSPETFVTVRGDQAVLKALAGTRPRGGGGTPERDEQLAAELRANAKEMAEHRMLVDLARNDLGRVCLPGSIQVGEIARLIRYSHVMHLATEVSGTLRPDFSGYEMIRSCFPRGTVSGAPKIRAMQLLAQLEPERRGVYSGMVGYIDTDGNTDGAIAIRSALVKDGMAHVQAGAGVVYHSTPKGEYQETRNKAKSVLTAIYLWERTVADALART